MQTRLISLAALTDDDVRAWQLLAAHAVEPNVFLDPRFLVPARRRPEVVHDLRLVVVQDGACWLAVLALTIKTIAPGLPVRAATTGGRFATTHSDRHHPLVRTGRVTEALQALLLGLRAVGLPGLVQLQHFPADGPLADALTRVVGRTSIRVHERRRTVSAFASRSSVVVPTGTVGPTGAAGPVLLASGHLGAGRRKDLRRRVRALERAAGGPLELHDVSADPGTDREFVALQAAGWKGDPERGGAALLLDPPAHRWFQDVAAGFRRTGDLLVLRLAAGGETVWTGYTLRSGGTWFGFLDAYAERHRRLSPGALGRLAELTHLFATTDAVHLDPAFEGRYATGTRLYPDRREHVDLLVSTRGLVARAAVRAAPVAHRLGLGAG
ncbi:MAG TPA: GNAT family N-acetyltransferase [Cellulomonas sp.]